MAPTVGTTTPRRPVVTPASSPAPTVVTGAPRPVASGNAPAAGPDGFTRTAAVETPRPVRAATAAQATPAEKFMEPLDRGFWQEKGKTKGRVNGYVDFAVQNYSFHKNMAVKLLVTRENGVVEEYLYRPHYKGQLPDGRERWGTDAVELYPQKGPHGAIKQIDMSFVVQADADGDGMKDLCQSKSTYRLAGPKDLGKPASGMGLPPPSGDNPVFGAPASAERAQMTSLNFKDGVPPIEVYFAPYDHPERAIVGEIDKVIQAKAADPQGRHYIHASVFDINDARIVDKLLEAHAQGVEVKLLTDASHLDPNKDWETQYQRLQQAGISVVAITREGFAASNHTKFAVFDGKVATTGSYNWESRAADENSENLMVLRSPEVAEAYADLFDAVGGGITQPSRNDPASKIQVFYSQRDNVPKVLYDEVEKAKDSVVMSMFTLRNLPFDDGGQKKDLLDALVRAQQRGVKVTILLEESIADVGEYFGRITPNDPTDEYLASQGVEIIKIKTNYNNNKYAALHHKFAVIDTQTTLTGAYNWYTGSQVSDDDVIMVRDPAIAQRYAGEITNLRRHYDPGFDAAKAPATPVQFSISAPQTRPGDTLYLVGDIPELGGWDPQKAIPLDGSGYPDWKASVDVPAGTHFQYKLFVKNHWGRFWEAGENRDHTANPAATDDVVKDAYR